MSAAAAGRLTLAVPFTVIPEPGCVRLIGGEDLRYTLRGPEVEQWLPPLVDALAAGAARAEALARVPPAHRGSAEALLARLADERVLVVAAARPSPAPYRAAVRGEGPLADALRVQSPPAPASAAPELLVLAQETMDLGAALAFDREARGSAAAWMWVTTGPVARAFVSPVFLADGGPCLGCLVTAFRRLSPAPELYDALLAHGARGGAFAPAPAAAEATLALAALAAWKARALAEPDAPAAIFELHVLELASFTVSAHPLAIDPDCPGAHGAA